MYESLIQKVKQVRKGDLIIKSTFLYNPMKRKDRVSGGCHFVDLTAGGGTVEGYILENYHNGAKLHYYPEKAIEEHGSEFVKAYTARLSAYREAINNGWTCICVLMHGNFEYLTSESELERLYDGEKIENIDKIGIKI